jgi:hypothetical protein
MPRRLHTPERVQSWTSVAANGQSYSYAGSTTIFFAARSICVIRKLRTCPARAGSALTGAPAPVFQRACSIELSEERSAAAGAEVSLLAGATDPALHIA